MVLFSVPPDFQGPYLKTEAQALLKASLSMSDALPGQEPFFSPVDMDADMDPSEGSSGNLKPAPGASASGMKEVPAASASTYKYAASGTKVPKWMKINK